MKKLDIRVWEVGAGLCIHIKTPNGQNHIIDVGKSPDFSPAEHIFNHYWTHKDQLDYLIISHQDKDHVEDLENLICYLGEPRVLLRNDTVPDVEKYGLLKWAYQQILNRLDKKYTYPVTPENNPRDPANNGGVTIRSGMLNWNQAKTINNASIVVAYWYQNVVVIFPGDIEDAGWNKLINMYPNLFLDEITHANTVILVAPHHGRKSGYSQNMIEYFNPDLVVISDGYGAGETDPRFRTCANGMEIKGRIRKFITTKNNGRKRITIFENGAIEISEIDA